MNKKVVSILSVMATALWCQTERAFFKLPTTLVYRSASLSVRHPKIAINWCGVAPFYAAIAAPAFLNPCEVQSGRPARRKGWHQLSSATPATPVEPHRLSVTVLLLRKDQLPIAHLLLAEQHYV